MSGRAIFLIISSLFLCLSFCISSAEAEMTEYAKLTASDGFTDDNFGYSVSISADFSFTSLAIVGAYGDTEHGVLSGSAYIFERWSQNWTELDKLVPSDGSLVDYFGYSVSISGDYAVVGAYADNDNGVGSGSAYIFKRDVSGWDEQVKLLPSDGDYGDSFGYSVSIDGDYVLVGAPYDDVNGYYLGSAYIFKRDGGSWSEQAKLLASDGWAGDRFGCSVSISGDYSIVGANFDDDNDYSSGSAYIFKRDSESWSQQAKLTASDAAYHDEFGGSVSISGDYVIVGSRYDDDNGSASGSAYIFKRDGESWSQQIKLVASDGDANDNFGLSVSIGSDYAVVGSRYDDDNGSESGSAYIFKRSGEYWNELTKLAASDGAAGDYFGQSVSISGGHIIVGAFGDDDNGANSGSAYTYNTNIFRSVDLHKNWHVDFFDYAILANDWLECGDAHDSNCTKTGALNGDIFSDYYVNNYDLWYFAECWLDCYVTKASVISPSDNESGVDPNIILTWSAGDGVLEHDVYFGTDANAVAEADYFAEEFKGTVSETNFDPNTLELNTEYYWRIDETGQRCAIKGNVWSFTTRE